MNIDSKTQYIESKTQYFDSNRMGKEDFFRVFFF
jgi:hypothetical protein